MREIDNLKLNLQLYGGHSLNLLTYDDLLRFELHLESSLQHAQARKVYISTLYKYICINDIYRIYNTYLIW